MINVAVSRAALASISGDVVALTKAQMDELLTEVEIGQKAQRVVTNMRSLLSPAASGVGASA